MAAAVNVILECFVTGLFTAGLLVMCTRLGLFPVIIVQTMTQEESDEADRLEKEDDDE